MIFKKVLQEGKEFLRNAGIEEADIDAWYLFEHCFCVSRAAYFLHENSYVGEGEYKKYQELIRARGEHIPLQHLLGVQEFMGLEFTVGPQVLIPRQDTELLVEEAAKVVEGKSVLDLCTGSGCIILSLSKLKQLKRAVGADISREALEIAAVNQKRLKASVTFVQSSLFENINEKFDVIVSNPPYIPTKDIEGLMPEVKEHEPLLALDGKEDGLYFYDRIIEGLAEYLAEDGYVFFEIGYNQGKEIKTRLEAAGFSEVAVKKDLAGLDRVVSGKKR